MDSHYKPSLLRLAQVIGTKFEDQFSYGHNHQARTFLKEYDGLREALLHYLIAELKMLKELGSGMGPCSWPASITVRALAGRTEFVNERDIAYDNYEIQRKLLGGPDCLNVPRTKVIVRP